MTFKNLSISTQLRIGIGESQSTGAKSYEQPATDHPSGGRQL